MSAAATTLTLVRDRQDPATLQATVTSQAAAYLSSGDPADLVNALEALEALEALGEVTGLDSAQLETYRHAKALRRGRFGRRLARPRRSGA
jgi:hypothetical protein